jgi:hypothetical protein
MNGIVFTEFLKLVKDKFELDWVDRNISKFKRASNKVHTASVVYSFTEMLTLLQNLNQYTSISINNLCSVCGEYIFSVIQGSYPILLSTCNGPVEMLSSIEKHIHMEVKKVCSGSALPGSILEKKENNSVTILYKSSRVMHHFGSGLMNKTFEPFNSTATIELRKVKADGSEARFIIHKN